MLHKQQQQRAGNEGEHQVVNLEQELQLERLERPHDLPSAKDDKVVRNDDTASFSKRSDWRLAIFEGKVPRRVASNTRPKRVVDGPKVKPERSVNRRDLDVDGLDEVLAEGRCGRDY